MILVPTYLDRSTVHGTGVFAKEDIPKGTTVWKEVSGFDYRLARSFVDGLDEIGKRYIETYSYLWNESYWVSIDNDRFINHSDTPNLTVLADGTTVANQTILAGTELTHNYQEFDTGV